MTFFSELKLGGIVSLLLAFSAVLLYGGTAATVPEGRVTITIAAGNGAAATDSFFTVPLLAPAEGNGQLIGKMTAVGSNTLSNSNGAWTASAFATTGSPYFARILSGPATGRIYQITANTSSQLTLDTQGVDLTTLGIVVGIDTYEIFPGDTLLSFFGSPGSPQAIVGGATPSSVADRVQMVENGAWVSYFYNTTAGQWRRGSLPVSQNNKVLHPNAPILFSRFGTTPLSYTVMGRVPDRPHVMTVSQNGDSAISTFFPTDQSLLVFGIENLSGWRKVGDVGITAANADKVFLLEAGSWIAYHYNATVSQWRRGSLPVSQNGKVVPALTGILLQRTGATGANSLTLTLPYPLN